MKKSICVLIMALVMGAGATVSAADYGNCELSSVVAAAASSGSAVITLTGDTYTWTSSIALDNSVTIQAAPGLVSRPTITYGITANATAPAVTGSMMTFAFSKPNTLTLDGVKIVYTTATKALVGVVYLKPLGPDATYTTATMNVSINNCVVESTAGVVIYTSSTPVSGTPNRTNLLGTLSITNSSFTGSMAQAVLQNGAGTTFTSYNIVNNYFKGFTAIAGVIPQQVIATSTALIDHCTFNACTGRELAIKASNNTYSPTTVRNTIFANSPNTANLNQFGWDAGLGAAHTIKSANKCAVYYTALGTVASIYPGYANAILNTDPSIDATSHYATAATYLVGANPGTDGKAIGFYNATPGAPTSVTATGGNAQTSVAFTAPSSDGGSAITTYRVTSNQGGFTNTGVSSPIVVTGLSNGTAYTFTVVAANANGTGTVSSASNSVTPSAAATPTITGTATTTAFTTTYGTPSTKQDFTVSSSDLSVDITATAPTGFEVASDGTTFGATSTITKNTSGTLSLRLKANAAVSGSYNGVTVSLESTGATTKYITTAASGNAVSAKVLTITGLTGTNKPYDGNTTASFTGTAAYSGLANSESHTVSGTPSASFASATAGDAKTITVSGYTAPNSNYSLSQPTLSGNITKVALTITANNQTVSYGTAAATVTGAGSYTATGFVNSETASVISGSATYSTTYTNSTAAETSGVTITPIVGSLTATNYSFTPADGTITISNALTVATPATNISDLTLTPSSVLTVSSGGSLVIDATTTVASVTVAQGGSLTVNNGVTLGGTVTLQSTTNGTATLVDKHATPTQAAIVEQHVSAGRNWYVSAPISVAGYASLNKGNSVVEFNETTKVWDPVTSGTLVAGKGYIQVATALQGTTGTLSFDGIANSGDITVTLSRTGTTAQSGYNLVGNPYPSYLSWSKITKVNTNVMSTAWFRTKTAGGAYVFATVNAADTNSVIVVDNSANTMITKYIPPMQAYWVRLNSGASTTNYTVTNAMRAHADNGSNKMKAPKLNTQQLVRLQVSNAVTTDEAVVYFNADAADGYDNYDSPKMSNNSASIPEVFTLAGTEKLVINGMSDVKYETEIPIGFSTGSAGDFSISASEFSNFEVGTRLILLDKNYPTIETLLTPETTYHFSAPVTATSTNRFSLLFRAPGTTTGIKNTEKMNAQVFVNAANQITIIAPEKCSYAIFNALGQLIENGTVNSKLQTANSKQQSGIYVVKVGNETTRVIVK